MMRSTKQVLGVMDTPANSAYPTHPAEAAMRAVTGDQPGIPPPMAWAKHWLFRDGFATPDLASSEQEHAHDASAEHAYAAIGRPYSKPVYAQNAFMHDTGAARVAIADSSVNVEHSAPLSAQQRSALATLNRKLDGGFYYDIKAKSESAGGSGFSDFLRDHDRVFGCVDQRSNNPEPVTCVWPSGAHHLPSLQAANRRAR